MTKPRTYNGLTLRDQAWALLCMSAGVSVLWFTFVPVTRFLLWIALGADGLLSDATTW